MIKLYNYLKKIFFAISSYLFFYWTIYATDTSIKDWLLNVSDNWNIIQSTSDDWMVVVWDLLVWIKESLTSLLILIAVWVFLYIWIKLIIARWNPEEFKKAMKHMVYAIVWIFVVSLAWATVSLVAWLNL